MRGLSQALSALLCFAVIISEAYTVQGAESVVLSLRGGSQPAKVLNGGGEKVAVELYSEALCPFCAQFIEEQLNDLFTSGLIEIVDLRVVPYGNARVLSNGTVECQHGSDECKLNRVESCVIYLYPNVSKWFSFLQCLEGMPRAEMVHEVQSCVDASKFNYATIEDCVHGPLGDKLMLANRLQTEGLKPPHEWTPWVVINGEPILDDFDTFQERICKAYRGVRPPACPKGYGGEEPIQAPKKTLRSTCKREPWGGDYGSYTL